MTATLGAGRDQGVVGDGVGSAAFLMHLIEQLHGQLPVTCLLACADQTAVGDHAALATLPNHFLEHLHVYCYSCLIVTKRGWQLAVTDCRKMISHKC